MSTARWVKSTRDWWLEHETDDVPPLRLYGRIISVGEPMRPWGIRSLEFSEVIGIRNDQVVAKGGPAVPNANTFYWRTADPPPPSDVEQQIAKAPAARFVSARDFEYQRRTFRRQEHDLQRERDLARLQSADVEAIAAKIAVRREILDAAAYGPRAIRGLARIAAFKALTEDLERLHAPEVVRSGDEKRNEIADRVVALVKPVPRLNPLDSLPKPKWLHAWWAGESRRRVGYSWTHVATAYWSYGTSINERREELYVSAARERTFSLWSSYGDEEYTLCARARFDSRPTEDKAALVLLKGWYEHLRDEYCHDPTWPESFTPSLIDEAEYRLVWLTVFGKDETAKVRDSTKDSGKENR